MNLYLFFALLGGLLVLAFIANRLVRYTHVPDVIILMATGILIGPVLHWVNPDIFRGATQGFGSLALILILFEAGLDLKLRELLRHFGSGFFLALLSYVLSGIAIAAACRFAFHFGRLDALLIGGAMGCVSGSILVPVLQQVRLGRELKVTLLVEAALGDAFAVLAVTTLLEIAAGKAATSRAIGISMVLSLLIAVAAGIVAGILWSYLLPVLSEQHFWHVLTFAAVLLLYCGVHVIHGNDLLSVLFFGMTLSNFPRLRKRLEIADSESGSDWFTETPLKGRRRAEEQAKEQVNAQANAQILTFHGELAFLLRTFFFVLLGILVDWAGLRQNIVLAVLCLAAILIARIVAVQAGRIVWRRFTALERELIVWFVPRGLITAVLGIEILEARGSSFDFLPSLAVAVILLTNVALLIGTVRARNIPEEPVADNAENELSLAPAEPPATAE